MSKKINLFSKIVIALAIFIIAGVSISNALENIFIFTKTSSTKEQVNAYDAQFSKLYSFNDGVLKLENEGNIDEDRYEEYRITHLDKDGEVIKSTIIDVLK